MSMCIQPRHDNTCKYHVPFCFFLRFVQAYRNVRTYKYSIMAVKKHPQSASDGCKKNWQDTKSETKSEAEKISDASISTTSMGDENKKSKVYKLRKLKNLLHVAYSWQWVKCHVLFSLQTIWQIAETKQFLRWDIKLQEAWRGSTWAVWIA